MSAGISRAEALLDETQGDENHPAMGLVDIVGDLIEDYETEHHPLPETTGVLALKFLIEQHGLKQSDLSEIGSQGVVSEILTAQYSTSASTEQALRGFIGDLRIDTGGQRGRDQAKPGRPNAQTVF